MPVQSQVRRDVDDAVRCEIGEAAVSHMVEVVNSTPVESQPFAHFVAHEIFPPAVYEEMLSLLPAQSLYKAFNRGKASDEGRQQRWSGDRARFKFTNASIDRLTGRQRSLWLGVRDALGSPDFKTAVFARLESGLKGRFGPDADVASLPGYPLPELFRETSGYKITPHPDTDKKVVTMQIALPSDSSQENLGTEFYRRSANPLHRWREPRGFAVAKRAPFLPNVAYAFVVTGDSWHGRTTLKGSVGVRNTILNIWYARPENASPDIVEELYKE